MKFGNPQYFWFLFSIPVVIGFFIWAYQRKQWALKRFASEQYYSAHSDKQVLDVLDKVRSYVSKRENLSVNEITVITDNQNTTHKNVAIIVNEFGGLCYNVVI